MASGRSEGTYPGIAKMIKTLIDQTREVHEAHAEAHKADQVVREQQAAAFQANLTLQGKVHEQQLTLNKDLSVFLCLPRSSRTHHLPK